MPAARRRGGPRVGPRRAGRRALSSGDLAAVPFDTADASEQYAAVVDGLGEVQPDRRGGRRGGHRRHGDGRGHAGPGSSTASPGPTTPPPTSPAWTTRGRSRGRRRSSNRRSSTGEHLTLTRTAAERGQITGAGDRAIVAPRDVVRLGLDKTKLTADRSTRASPVGAGDRSRTGGRRRGLHQAGRGGRRQGVRRGARAPRGGGDHRRPARLRRHPRRRRDSPTSRTSAPSRGFAAPILGSVGDATAEIIEESGGAVEAGDVVGLSGLQARYDDQLSGTPGLSVIAAGADNDRAVHEVPAVAGTSAGDHARHRPADQGGVGARRRRPGQRASWRSAPPTARSWPRPAGRGARA